MKRERFIDEEKLKDVFGAFERVERHTEGQLKKHPWLNRLLTGGGNVIEEREARITTPQGCSMWAVALKGSVSSVKGVEIPVEELTIVTDRITHAQNGRYFNHMISVSTRILGDEPYLAVSVAGYDNYGPQRDVLAERLDGISGRGYHAQVWLNRDMSFYSKGSETVRDFVSLYYNAIISTNRSDSEIAYGPSADLAPIAI